MDFLEHFKTTDYPLGWGKKHQEIYGVAQDIARFR
jgi:hypothetical protein